MSFPYHAGEIAVQALAGQSGRAEARARLIATRIVPGAWEFLAAQAMVVLGSWDGKRGVWPSLVFGPPGFAATRDGSTVELALASRLTDAGDPLWDNLCCSERIGLLVIDLATRHRLRISGHLRASGQPTDRLEIAVERAYPNCPKYIQRRRLRLEQACSGPLDVRISRALTEQQVGMIAAADTCFVASMQRDSGIDVSHRGGRPGFVRVESGTRLRIPDYAGNGMFNTLGNIYASGFAGILVMDFTQGKQLQLIGDAGIDWSRTSAAVERSWWLDIQCVRESSLPAGLAWEFIDASPLNPDA